MKRSSYNEPQEALCTKNILDILKDDDLINLEKLLIHYNDDILSDLTDKNLHAVHYAAMFDAIKCFKYFII